uniref:Uncharacterized protein n=1 Tax=Panagrolaimus davidi TaxID=227884 RepID=A0A914Q5H4_9BILA
MASSKQDIHKLPEGHHSGEENIEKALKKFYNLKTIEEYKEYYSKPIYTDFSHIHDISYPDGRSLKVFMVSEKNLMSAALASRLGFRFVVKRYYDEYGLISVEDAKEKDPKEEKPFLKLLQFKCEIFGRMAEVLMAATNGHLFISNFEKKLEDPTEAFVLEIIKKKDEKTDNHPSPTPADSTEINDEIAEKKFRQNYQKNFIDFAGKAAKGSDAVVLFLDNDNAGEYICYQVIDVLIDSLEMPPTGNKMDVIYR